jgi:hypothetical protein
VIRPVTPVPALSRILPLFPDDDRGPDVFRVDLSGVGGGSSRVVFTRSPGGRVTALHLDLAALSFDRRPTTPAGR